MIGTFQRELRAYLRQQVLIPAVTKARRADSERHGVPVAALARGSPAHLPGRQDCRGRSDARCVNAWTLVISAHPVVFSKPPNDAEPGARLRRCEARFRAAWRAPPGAADEQRLEGDPRSTDVTTEEDHLKFFLRADFDERRNATKPLDGY